MTAPPTKSRKGRRILLILAALAVMLIAGPQLYKRYAAKVRGQWTKDAIAQVEKMSADAGMIAQDTARLQKSAGRRAPEAIWTTDRLALMGDGKWVVFRQQCVKVDRRVGDLFIGKGSDGKWYYSTFHFCTGMIVTRMFEQPKDLQTFLVNYSVREFSGKPEEELLPTWSGRMPH